MSETSLSSTAGESRTAALPNGSAVPSAARRWRMPAAEVVVAFGFAGLLTALGTTIDNYPLERTGQVSSLAMLEWHYLLVALPVIASLLIAARVRGGAWFPMTARLACAAIAGMATGIVAAGLLAALYGTPWGLNGSGGDAGNLILWTDAVRHHHRTPPAYPPLPFRVIAHYADLFDLKTGYAMKHMQVIGTAIMGPFAYLAWRLVLRPSRALVVGLVAALPLIDNAPYRPYANLVLIVFIPVAVWFLDALRRIDERSVLSVARRGAAAGAAMGLLCLTYSGWFQWSAPGFLVAMLVVFPWRRAPRRGLVMLGAAGAMFAAVTWRYLIALLTQPALFDKYVYFDVNVEPSYIAMFRGDLPGPVGNWPPFGELGGVGLFTVVLVLGLGTAIALGRGRTLVIAVSAMFVGAWALRFRFASGLWETKNVQLYPRTTTEILYCLLILALFAACLVIDRVWARAPAEHGTSGQIGLLCALLYLFASAGSSISDHYMPNSIMPISPGWLSLQAHRTPT